MSPVALLAAMIPLFLPTAAAGIVMACAGILILRRQGGMHPSPLGLLKTGCGILLLIGGLVLAMILAPILYFGS